MSYKPECRILGLQEIADFLQVNKRTPHAWAYRKQLPAPDHESINGLRAWDRSTMVLWAGATGRLPEELTDEFRGLAANEGTPMDPVKRGSRKASVAAGQAPTVDDLRRVMAGYAALEDEVAEEPTAEAPVPQVDDARPDDGLDNRPSVDLIVAALTHSRANS